MDNYFFYQLINKLRKIYGICYYKGATIFYCCLLSKYSKKIYGVFDYILYFPEGTTIFYGYINRKISCNIIVDLNI